MRLPEFLVGDRARLVLEPLQAEPGRHVQRERVDAVAIEDDDVVIGLEIAAAMLVFSVAECIAFFERMGAHDGRFPQVVIERTLQGLWDGFAPRHVDPPATPPASMRNAAPLRQLTRSALTRSAVASGVNCP